MKYIRTKEELGIEREDGVCCFKTWVAYADSPLKKDWLYADTIEELCDEWVFFDNESKPHYKSQEPEGIWILGASLYTDSLRLGIFTDKGLIYVAKMNKKGEFELL